MQHAASGSLGSFGAFAAQRIKASGQPEADIGSESSEDRDADFPDLGPFWLNGRFRRFATGPCFSLQRGPKAGLSCSRLCGAKSRHSANLQQF